MPARRAASPEEHEAGLVAFLMPERRTRCLRSLQNSKGRRKLYDELYHFDRRLDPRSASRVEQHVGHEQYVADVCALLVDEGAPPTCFVFGTIDLDGQETPLPQAVKALMWTGAGFISCIAGTLGLYVGEDGSNVFLLRRKP